MKYRILQPFKSVTANGEQELHPGQEITIQDRETAFRLIGKGKITPVEKVAYRIYSNILQAYLWVVDTDQDMHTLRSQEITEAIYTADEIKKLKGLSKDSLIEIHKVKQVFEKSKVMECKKKNENL